MLSYIEDNSIEWAREIEQKLRDFLCMKWSQVKALA